MTIWEGLTYTLDGEGAAVVTGDGSTKVVISEDVVVERAESAAMKTVMNTYNDQQSQLLKTCKKQEEEGL